MIHIPIDANSYLNVDADFFPKERVCISLTSTNENREYMCWPVVLSNKDAKELFLYLARCIYGREDLG